MGSPFPSYFRLGLGCANLWLVDLAWVSTSWKHNQQLQTSCSIIIEPFLCCYFPLFLLLQQLLLPLHMPHVNQKREELPYPRRYCVVIQGQPIKLPLVGDGGGCDIAIDIFHLLTPRGRERIGEGEKERRKRQNEKKKLGA